jgi:hypothetical protein
VQPSQEVAADIDALSTKTGTPLIALLNPQWRYVDDALDSASKSGGVVGAFASFLGGKGSVLRRLEELDYRSTFTLEGYVCKGRRLLTFVRMLCCLAPLAATSDLRPSLWPRRLNVPSLASGGNIRLIKRFDSDWVVFAENDSGDQYVKVGSMAVRPTYQDVEQMLNDKGVGYKYARDLGMAPKL